MEHFGILVIDQSHTKALLPEMSRAPAQKLDKKYSDFYALNVKSKKRKKKT